jgi:hypothetical protein
VKRKVAKVLAAVRERKKEPAEGGLRKLECPGQSGPFPKVKPNQKPIPA